VYGFNPRTTFFENSAPHPRGVNPKAQGELTMVAAAGVTGGGTLPTVGFRRFDVDIMPSDSDFNRERIGRWLSFISTTAAAVVIPIALGWYVGSKMGRVPAEILAWAGTAAAYFPIRFALTRGLVDTDPWQATGTQYPNGTMAWFGGGIKPEYPISKRAAQWNVNLRYIPKTFTVTVPTKTSTVDVKVTIQYMADPKNLSQFLVIRNNPKTLNDNFVALMKGFLTTLYASLNSLQVRAALDDTNTALEDRFMGAVIPGTRETPTIIETKNGIIMVSVIIEELVLPPHVQSSLGVVDEAHGYHNAVAASMGITSDELKAQMASGAITPDQYKDMLVTVMGMGGDAFIGRLGSIGGMPGLFGAIATPNNANI
jgi:hypothetical protein